MPFPQSRSRRFPIPFPAFLNPAPAFRSDGSGSACFAIPPRPLSAPHGNRFSGGGPAGVPAWNPQALLPCAGGGPTRHTQTRPPVRPCGAGQAPKTRPPGAGGRLLYVSCGSRQKVLRPRDGGRRAPPLGPSSSSPLRSGGPAGRSRPASGPNWNRFRVKIFVFAPAGLDGIPAKWYRMILVGGWRIAVHAAGRIHSPAAHAANPSFSTAPRNKYAPAGRHTRAAFAPQRNVRWEELHCRTFWICSPT